MFHKKPLDTAGGCCCDNLGNGQDTRADFSECAFWGHVLEMNQRLWRVRARSIMRPEALVWIERIGMAKVRGSVSRYALFALFLPGGLAVRYAKFNFASEPP